jgi:tripartite-type tricarboxylate transporter receptor subunit TctC
MSKDHVAKLNAALKTVLANQKVADGIANFGVQVKTSTPEQHRQDVVRTTRIYTAAASKLGITPN